ncbi:MAG: hypothetical protein HZC28_19765 [Spirochaetes bacterium]|nr:hypothetical protein [Spirochaetota bacterium]
MKKYILFFAMLLPLFGANDLSDLLNTDLDLKTNAVVKVGTTNVDEPTSLFSLTGQLTSISSYNMVRDFVQAKGIEWYNSNSLGTKLNAELYVDIRLRESIKGYADLAITYNPLGEIGGKNVALVSTNKLTTNYWTLGETNNLILTVKELFIDANIAKVVYLRTGKQVLAWGQGYFWNPSDLINIQKKDFANITTANLTREGTYGIKMHVPFGTTANLYGFLNMKDIKNFDDIGVAGKIEALLFGWEGSVSGVASKGYRPVYAADLTGRIPFINVDVRGEASLSYGDNKNRLYSSNVSITFPITTNYTTYYTQQVSNEWVPRICVGFSKSFDVLDVKDRLTVLGEYFYNAGGYNGDGFRDSDQIKKYALFSLYEPNYFGVHYGFLAVSVSKFILSDMTFNFNVIANCSDWSGVVVAGISYNPVYNFTIGCSLSGNVGTENGEYTLASPYTGLINGMSATVTVALTF